MSETVIFSKASVERKDEYRQLTLIMTDGERRWVRKTPVGKAAAGHMHSYAANLKALNDSLKPGHAVDMIPCRENADGSVDFPFLTDPTLGERLAGLGMDDYVAVVRAFENALTSAFETCAFQPGEDFEAFFGMTPDAAGTTALVVPNPDLNFDNVFCTPDGRYTIIDYEWLMPFPLPVSFLIYRSLMLGPAFNAFSVNQRYAIMEQFGIDARLEEQYHRMELAFLAAISPEEYKLDYFARVEGARQNAVYSFDYLEGLPREIRMLSDEYRKLSDEMAREIDAHKREIEINTYLINEHNRLIELYNKSTGALWFRGVRKLSLAFDRLDDALAPRLEKHRVPQMLWKGLTILLRQGPVTLARRVKDKWQAHAAAKQFVRRLTEPLPGEIPDLPKTIKFSVLVPLYNTQEAFLREMIESVQKQTYPNWELCLADGSDDQHPEVGRTCLELAAKDGRIVYKKLDRNGGISENTNACIDMATGDYVALFDHDDLLHPSALYENARAIQEQGADFLYSDEVVFISPDITNLVGAHFKPDFSPESLYSNNYICHLSVFRRSLLEKTGGFRKAFDGSQDHDLILRLTDAAQKVVHIPKVLYLWRSHPASVASDIGAKTYAIEAGRNAVKDFLVTRRGMAVTVESTPDYPTLYHVQFPVDRSRTVDVILDWTGRNRAETANCLERLMNVTDWPLMNYVVVAAEEPARSERARFPRVKWVVSLAEGCSARLNAAAQASRGDLIVFMEPDLICDARGWIEQMLMLADQHDIGAVGGKIYCTDQALRQAGLILGLGKNRLVGRSHFLVPRDNSGYFGQLAIVGDVSAVSAECMMVARGHFEAVRGFDEGYGDALFDVDLCLKLSRAGYRNVFTPFATFIGGVSKHYAMDYGVEANGYDAAAEMLRQKWPEALDRPDPCYNPNLTLDHADFRIGLE